MLMLVVVVVVVVVVEVGGFDWRDDWRAFLKAAWLAGGCAWIKLRSVGDGIDFSSLLRRIVSKLCGGLARVFAFVLVDY